VREGSAVGEWRVERIYGVKMGAVPVVLSTADGRRVQLNVHRRDPSGANGVGTEGGVTVVVVNRGHGSDSTDEQFGLGAMALATVLAERERSGAALPALLTIEQRSRRFPAGVFEVPV
jgi:hypothetical protein